MVCVSQRDTRAPWIGFDDEFCRSDGVLFYWEGKWAFRTAIIVLEMGSLFAGTMFTDIQSDGNMRQRNEM